MKKLENKIERKYFTTSDGRKINLIPNWYGLKTAWPYGIDNLKEWSEHIYTGTPTHPTGYIFFVNKLTMFNYFYEMINEHFVDTPKKWKRCLDIGTGLGFQPRLMKAVGMCEEAWGLDILDRSGEMSNELMANSITDFKKDMYDLSSPMSNRVIKVVANRSIDMCIDYPVSTPYILTDKSDYSLDKYVVSDFMKWKPGNVKFDIITAIFVIDFFNISDMFEKLYSLLNPGGIFFVIAGNWYDVFGASMNLPMDSPWLHSRLSREDLIRYYYEVRPEIAPYAEKCIYFVDSHLSPIDYAIKASEKGMKMITYRRSKSAVQDLVLPSTTGTGATVLYSEVVPEAKIINPNVSAPDLFAYYYTMIFRKD